MDSEQLTKAVLAGFNILSSKDIRVPASEIESLATLKDVLSALMNGSLILATPDRLIPEGVKSPKNGDIKIPEEEKKQ